MLKPKARNVEQKVANVWSRGKAFLVVMKLPDLPSPGVYAEDTFGKGTATLQMHINTCR